MRCLVNRESVVNKLLYSYVTRLTNLLCDVRESIHDEENKGNKIGLIEGILNTLADYFNTISFITTKGSEQDKL